MNNESVIDCLQLVKRYRQGEQDLLVLDQVDLSVKKGERVAIVGASGSGKSTLLNVLGGLDEPQQGEVRIAGKVWQSLGEKERAHWRNCQLGFVYQFHHLLAEFSALENVLIPLLIAGVKKREAAIQAHTMLMAVGLAERATHKPAQLSGGERQRVAIARALVNKPACVLMDEPTGNLDADNAQQIQALLNSLNREFGMAFVLVTHDRTLAAQQDRCLLLDHGKLTDITGEKGRLMLTRFIALRYAQSSSGSRLLGFISRLSMAGLVVAVALLITVLSVMNGFEHELRTRILRVVPAITLSPAEGEIENWKEVALVVLRNKRIMAASPLIEAQGLLVAGQQSEPVMLFATDPEAESRLSHFEEFAGADVWAAWKQDPQSVLVSRKVATQLNLQADSTIVMMLPSLGKEQSEPSMFSVRIAGFYETGTEIDNHLVLAQLPLLQKQYGMKGVSAIRFTVENWLDAREVAEELVMLLPPGFNVRTWLTTHGNLYQAIQMSRQMVVLMLALIVVVAAFNVVCSLVLVVTDKRGDIAILRAMGVPNSQVMQIFVFHGVLIGATGTLLGALFGCGLARAMPAIAKGLEQLLGIQFLSTDIYPVNYLPSDLRATDVAVVVLTALVLSALASIYPAWRATHVQPADVLRHE